MKTITFYSYKGGVGRSLALANVADRLSEFGKKVCILDFDLEAPGLHLKFENYITQEIKKGIVDYIHEFTSTGSVPGQIKEFMTQIYPNGSERRKPIMMIAAGNTQHKHYWSKVCSIDWKQLFYEEDSMGVEFFYNLKAQISKQLKPDFLLIDSRTGITDISGVTMSIMADEVVLLGANNRENIEGVTQVIKTLLVPENSLSGKVPKINFILSRIPYFSSPKDKPKEANAKIDALNKINKAIIDAGHKDFQLQKVFVLHSDRELELEETFKIGHGQKTDVETETVIGKDYLDLFEEITQGMISDMERAEFDKYIRVGSLIEKSKSSSNTAERIKFLEAAIEIDKNSATAYAELGVAYFGIGLYPMAMSHFEKAVSLNPAMDLEYKWNVAACSFHLKEFDKALKLYMDLLKILPGDSNLLSQIGGTYYSLKDYKKADEYFRQAVDASPTSSDAWNSYANNLRVMGQLDAAMDAIYTALQLNPQSAIANGTLAEIYAELGNIREFYKNLELSFSFGMDSSMFQRVLEEEKVYAPYLKDNQFLMLLKKYNIEINWDTIDKSF